MHSELPEHAVRVELPTRDKPSSLRGISRRALLKRCMLLGASFAVGGRILAASDAAWAMELEHLEPDTMATLIQMARDIYPHDRVADAFYARAVKSYDSADAAAATDAGIAELNEAAVAAGYDNYLAIGWERDRVAVLKSIETGDFFQQVRSGLVTGLYNQKELWPIFGYEGESFLKGGYIDHGFDDIDWI